MPTEEKDYHKPKSVAVPKVSGYPQTDIGIDDVWVKGKYPANAKRKNYHTTRGAGAATRGKKFLESDDM